MKLPFCQLGRTLLLVSSNTTGTNFPHVWCSSLIFSDNNNYFPYDITELCGILGAGQANATFPLWFQEYTKSSGVRNPLCDPCNCSRLIFDANVL